VSHHLVGVGADVIAPFAANMALSITVGIGLSAGTGLGFGVWFVFGFGIGIDLSCLPGCRCLRASGSSSPPVCVRSGCIEDSNLAPSVSAFLSSFWSRSVAATTLTTMSVIPLPHSTSSWWYVSRLFSFSSNHNFIPHHCASGSAMCVSSMITIFAIVQCSCASSRACC